MNKRLLITRSTHDKANSYLYAFTQLLMEDAQLKGWKVDSADNAKNTRKELESRLRKNKPTLIMINGHGNNTQICGNQNEVIMDTKNIDLASESILFARSCDSLTVLGKKSIEKGCRAFIGYRAKFLLPRVREYEARPLNDPAAKPVLEVSNSVAFGLLKGLTAYEAVHSCHQHANKWIIKMLTSEEPYYNAAIRALVHNDQSLGYEGNQNACAKD